MYGAHAPSVGAHHLHRPLKNTKSQSQPNQKIIITLKPQLLQVLRRLYEPSLATCSAVASDAR